MDLRRQFALVAPLLMLSVVAAGCRGDGSEDPAASTGSTATAVASDTPGPSATVEAEEPARSFAVELPDGWTESTVEAGRERAYVYRAPGAGGEAGDNVNIRVGSADVDDLAELDGILSVLPDDATVVEDVHPSTLGGAAATAVIFDGTVGDVPARFWIVWTVHQGTSYVFTYRATPGSFDENRPGAVAIYESFEFTA